MRGASIPVSKTTQPLKNVRGRTGESRPPTYYNNSCAIFIKLYQAGRNLIVGIPVNQSSACTETHGFILMPRYGRDR